MSAIVFASDDTTLTFTRNPSYPQSRAHAHPVRIYSRSGHGTVHVEDKGSFGRLTLTWPRTHPMTTTDYHLGTDGANLLEFWREVRGYASAWTFTDENGAEHDARFASVPEFSHVEKGFAGSVGLYLLT